MKKLVIAVVAVAIGTVFAPIANADPNHLDGNKVIPLFPTAGGPHPYATGYNISPRYEFATDPVTGKRHAKFDNGCHGAC